MKPVNFSRTARSSWDESIQVREHVAHQSPSRINSAVRRLDADLATRAEAEAMS